MQRSGAVVDIATLGTIAGKLPPRATALVIEWAQQHQNELQDAWDRSRRMQPLNRDAPPP